MKDQQQILAQLQQWLEELFEIEPEKVQLDAHLYDDLDIDSIDAVDLIVKIKEHTGEQIKPEDFKSVRTVSDVVTAIANLHA